MLVPRETPLSVIHLENMLTLARAGAVILPPAPGFYTHPRTVADSAGLRGGPHSSDQLGLPHQLQPRWGEPE